MNRAEDVLRPKAGERICDFVCVDGETITFIEAKAARFRMEADVTKLEASLAADVSRRGGFGDAVAQLADSIYVHRTGRSSLPARRRLLGLIVTPGERVGLNTSLVRRLISQSGAHQSAPQKLTDYLIADDLGFDALMRFAASGRPFGSTLWRVIRSSQRENDVQTHFFDSQLQAHPLAEGFKKVTERLVSELR